MTEPISRLRRIRAKADRINSTLSDDLRPFVGVKDPLLFKRLPTSDEEGNVTTTCSNLMAMSTSHRLLDFFREPGQTDSEVQIAVGQRLLHVIESPWTSSGLPDGNAFSSLMILRTAAILLQNADIDTKSDPLRMKHTFKEHPKPSLASKKKKKKGDPLIPVAPPFTKNETLSLRQILHKFADEPPNWFGVDDYPSTSALAYWFVDAVEKFAIELQPDRWSSIIRWVAENFARQVSLTTSKHDALKDPVEMAMAACLAERLRKISTSSGLTIDEDVRKSLPTTIEIHNAIRNSFAYQEKSGIWPKYFPLFNYREGGAGSNYLFSFELLEVIVAEFGESNLFEDRIVLSGLERTLDWCESNRLSYKHEGKTYNGWNSGGQITTLRLGKPESWATSMVHLYLYKLQVSLSYLIKKHVLIKYRVQPLELLKPNDELWQKLIDSPVTPRHDRTPTTAKRLIEDSIIPNLWPSLGRGPMGRIEGCRSALLFGPPGTSKTSLVRNLATKIGWPLVELNPSDFLKEGLENIYSQANEIFEDLRDLWQTVIFFDEMDALAQRRSGAIDVTRQFLTTSMLPKLSMLHDNARVVFFMATNHQRNFDDAIKRPGRFDLLICMAPPTWDQKVANLEAFWTGPKESNDVEIVRQLLNKWVPANHRLVATLDLFTYSEFKSLLATMRGSSRLRVAVEKLGPKRFYEEVQEWGEKHILLREAKAPTPDDISLRDEFELDMKASVKQC